MPLEPRHGRRIPDPRRTAKVLARVLRAMRLTARRQVVAGKPVDLRAYEPVLAAAVAPLMAHEWAWGAEGVRRGLRARSRRRVRVKAASALTAESVGLAFDLFRPEAATAAQRMALELAGEVVASSVAAVRNAVQRGIENGRTLDQISGSIAEHFTPQRAYTIAATETSRAMHQGQLDAARASGVVTGLKWLASADACPECERLNGKVVGLGQPFYVDPSGGPYAVVRFPPRHPNCMCAVQDVIDTPKRKPNREVVWPRS